ncbi:MAG: acyl-CoA dehydrogenase family protein [Acidimicrobiales bacterium]|jgi:alkylation response protein AidB-like acyl-CoA dehydrogenase
MAEVTEGEVRGQVLEWFHEVWNPDVSLIEWRTKLLESGWAVPSWSTEWFGQGLPAWADGVAHSAIRTAGGVALPLGAASSLAAPTLYEHANDDLKGRALRPALTGEHTWCQLFSEPGAGSDLAGLKCTAVRDGDTWIVNGQKVWNTSADHADMAILVTRHDWDAVKHAGLTYFVLDMHQEGVEVRPIEQMNYHHSFMEVFLTDARIPHENMVGGIGDGWRVARATLAHERRYAGERRINLAHGTAGRVVDEAKAEAAIYNETYKWYPQRMGRPDLVIERAQAAGRIDDLVLRDDMMKLYSLEKASRWTAERAKANRALGRPPGSEGSIGKLATSEVARRCNALHTRIAGADGMLKVSADPVHSVIAEVLVSTPAQSIAGGTDEIQHNILGESFLGLPKEPAADRGKPYRDVGRN